MLLKLMFQYNFPAEISDATGWTSWFRIYKISQRCSFNYGGSAVPKETLYSEYDIAIIYKLVRAVRKCNTPDVFIHFIQYHKY
jgi:hypothetical protein